MNIKDLQEKIRQDKERNDEDAENENSPPQNSDRSEWPQKTFKARWGHMACSKDYKECECRNGEHEVRNAIYQIGEWIKTI